MADLQCQFCGAPVPLGEPIPRDGECESCRHDLRCCRNCRHYDPRYNNACTEPMADPVEDKAHRNFCEYFYFNRAAFTAGPSTAAREAEARRRLGALFGDAPAAPAEAKQKPDARSGGGAAPGDRAEDARRHLDALFGKRPPPDDED